MLNKNKGFTLAEVVLSFVIISIIGLLVGHTFTSAYAMSSKLEEIPKNYYKAQMEIENEILKLSNDISEFCKLDNEIKNQADSEIELEKKVRYQELKDILDEYSKKTITLFDKEVDLYTFANEDTKTRIIAGGVNFISHNHTVPIIKNVTINDGKPDKYGLFEKDYDVYNIIDRKVIANVQIDNKNSSELRGINYDWYVASKDYHTISFNEGYQYGLDKFGNVLTVFPNGFELVKAGPDNYVYADGEEFYNRLLVCVATPISKEGSAGMPKVSNYVYVSGLPILTLEPYSSYSTRELIKFNIDPSLEQLNYTTEDEIDLSEIHSKLSYKNKNVKLYAQGTNYPKLNLIGDYTNDELPDDAKDKLYFSRYIKFDNNSSMKTKNLHNNRTILYVVARDRNNEHKDFIFTNIGDYGFDPKDDVIMTEPGENGWQIIKIKLHFRISGEIEIGKSNVDIAEILGTISTSEMGWRDNADERILEYLSEKYDIDVDDIEDEEFD